LATSSKVDVRSLYGTAQIDKALFNSRMKEFRPNKYQEHQFVIRSMTKDDLDLAILWAEQEGWNPGLYDSEPFRAADPEGFLIGLLDGLPIAAISAVRYGTGFGFIGFYIVKAEFRGQGFGLTLWSAAMERLKGRIIGLDGVLAQQDNYRQSGFKLAHHNMRFEGVVAHEAISAKDDAQIIPLCEVAITELIAYDRKCFPESRVKFLDAWISQPSTISLAVVRQNQIIAYGVARPCKVGWKIGPLFANSPQLAEQIFQALQLKIPSEELFFIDVSGENAAAISWIEKRGLLKVFETVRMYRGPAPSVDHRRIFGITSFELG
jgi:ribosomal protein S18 acetylase RimI-like enzyme